jgi:Glycine-zipper domain
MFAFGGKIDSVRFKTNYLDFCPIVFRVAVLTYEGCAVARKSVYLASIGVACLVIGGCASPQPATPSLAVMPGKGKSYEAFQREDQYCQASAQQAIGYQSPGETANQAAVGSAAVGTALGALTGGAIGSLSGNVGAGAAIGAGTGLVAGSAVGTGNARAAGGSVQARYDTVYAQCMTAKGNRVAAPAVVAEPVYVYPRPYYWGPTTVLRVL